MEMGGGTAVLEICKVLLPFLVLQSVLPLAFQLICPPGQLNQEQFFPLDPLPHDIQFGKRLLFFYIKLRDTRDFINNLSPLEVTPLHDAGPIPLHHNIVTMGFYPMPCEVVDNIALLAETFIQVIIAVIPVAGTFYSSPDLRPVRKFECHLCGVPAGIEVNQIGS